jgi:hypothetical protein
MVMLMHKSKNKNLKILIASLVLVVGGVLIGSGSWFSNSAQAAFPTTSGLIDNFNRADNVASTQPTSSGANWSTNLINDPVSSDLAVAANQLRANSAGTNGYITTTYGPDSEVYADVSALPGNGQYIALWGRIQEAGTSNFDSYALVYVHSTSGNATWSLRRYINGSGTTLNNVSAPALVAGESLGINIIGTGNSVTLTAYKKSGGTWSTVGSVIDSDPSRITSAGNIGIELGDTIMRIDNFGGGTVVTNTTPAAPTLSIPANNTTDVSTSPQFQLSSTDADGDYLRYKIELCLDAACSTVLRTIDQTTDQAGWTGQDQQVNTAYTGSATLASSTMAAHNYQSPSLSPNTQYWWRAYAIDPAGVNAFGLPSSIFSFTTAADPSLPGSGGSSGSGNSSTSGQNDTTGSKNSSKTALESGK